MKIKSDKIKYNVSENNLSSYEPVSEIKSDSFKYDFISPTAPTIDSFNEEREQTWNSEKIFTKHTRDYYRGKSFYYAGYWDIDQHYENDAYNVDFIKYENCLLVCKKSHFSSNGNKPVLNYNSRGDAESVSSEYWDLVLTGIHGKSPGIRINPETGHWEICEDTSVPEEEQVWVDTGFGDYMPISGGTFTGPVIFDSVASFLHNVDLSGNNISNVGNPIEDGDAINKAFLNFTIEQYPASDITNDDIERWDASSIWINENKE